MGLTDNAPERKNESAMRSPIDAGLTQPCSLSVHDIRRHLAGRRLTCAPVVRPFISNLITQIGNFERCEPWQRENLAKAIEANIQRIEAAQQTA